MKSKLYEREWLILISFGVIFLTLIFYAYKVKETVDLAIQDYFYEKKT